MRAQLLDAMDEVTMAQSLIELLVMAAKALNAHDQEPVLAGLSAAEARLMGAYELLEMIRDEIAACSTSGC